MLLARRIPVEQRSPGCANTSPIDQVTGTRDCRRQITQTHELNSLLAIDIEMQIYDFWQTTKEMCD